MKQIWFSGAIFSRREIFHALSIVGDPSDKELCAQAFDRWHHDTPRHLNGEYAFAIVEDDGDTIFCARDHIGAHPFFYSVMDGNLYWAASIEELLQDLPRQPEFDERYIASYLTRPCYQDLERTFYEGIFKLPPGHLLIFRDGSVAIQRYWHPGEQPELKLDSETAYIEEGRRLLSLAVAERTVDKVGVHISGGLDSSAVAAIATQTARKNGWRAPLGFAWHPDGPDGSDANLIDIMQAHCSIEVETCELNIQTICELLRDDPTMGSEPLDIFHESPVQKAAKRHDVQIILSGWGGDEGLSFNGRGLPIAYIARADLRKMRKIAPGSSLRAMAHVVRCAYREWRTANSGKKKIEASLADAALLGRARPYPQKPKDFPLTPRSIPLYAFKSGIHVHRLESWAESGRRAGITYRYPLLDRRVIEFALSIPPYLFRRNGEKRWFFRTLTEGIIPDPVRLNTSKLEALRVDALQDALAKAVAAIGDGLGPDSQYDRARYIDMEKLRNALNQSADHRFLRQSPLRSGLQFLDT